MRKIIKTKKLINGVSKKILENKCIIIENGWLKTMWRRNQDSPKTCYGSRVDNVRYGY